MTAPLAEVVEEGRRLAEAATLPATKWEHIEKGRIYFVNGDLVASVREQIPDNVDPDGDDPEAWEIGDAAVEEAGRRAELVAFLVNNAALLLAVAEAAVALFAALDYVTPGWRETTCIIDEDSDEVNVAWCGLELALEHEPSTPEQIERAFDAAEKKEGDHER